MNVSNISTASPTTWTIRKAIPFYTMKIHQDLGFGLGLNSTQGREAKHSKLASYVKNTTKGKRLRWRQVFKHDFMETIWLKEKNPWQITYRRGNVVEEQEPKATEKDKFIPSHCEKDTFCDCRLPKPSDLSNCEVCISEMFNWVKSSCQKGSIDGKISSLCRK